MRFMGISKEPGRSGIFRQYLRDSLDQSHSAMQCVKAVKDEEPVIHCSNYLWSQHHRWLWHGKMPSTISASTRLTAVRQKRTKPKTLVTEFEGSEDIKTLKLCKEKAYRKIKGIIWYIEILQWHSRLLIYTEILCRRKNTEINCCNFRDPRECLLVWPLPSYHLLLRA